MTASAQAPPARRASSLLRIAALTNSSFAHQLLRKPLRTFRADATRARDARSPNRRT